MYSKENDHVMNSQASEKKQFTWKHYAWLAVWWLSMGYALDEKAILLGILIAIAFFFLTTYKVLGKLLILMVAVFFLTIIFPPLGAVIAAASLIFFLLRIKFVVDNWRALLVGMYAYGVYLLVVLFNNFFYDHIVIHTAGMIFQFFLDGSPEAVSMIGQGGVNVSHQVAEYGAMALHIAAYIFPGVLTLFFHRMLCWLYRHGYSTDRAFYVMGLTPLLMMAFILPFLKIDINGHELFHGSFSDGIDALDGVDGIDGIDSTEDMGNTLSLKSDIELPSNVQAMLDYADVDIGTMLEGHVQTISPAIEASIASAASRGVFLVDEHLKRTGEVFTLSDENGSVQTIQYVSDDYAVIKDTGGHQVGSIAFDRQNESETVRLADGFSYTIDKTNGIIVDADGKLLGWIKDGPNGDKLLVNGKDEVIRKYQADGFILNGRGNFVGNVAMA